MEAIENQWILRHPRSQPKEKIHERVIQIAENPISTTKQTATTTATAKEIIENHLSSSNMHWKPMETIENQWILNITSKISTKGSNYVRKPWKLLRSQCKHKKANNSNNSNSNHRPQHHRGGRGNSIENRVFIKMFFSRRNLEEIFSEFREHAPKYPNSLRISES